MCVSIRPAGVPSGLLTAGKRMTGRLALKIDSSGCEEQQVLDALHQSMAQGPFPAVKDLQVLGPHLCSGACGAMLLNAFPAFESLQLQQVTISGPGLFQSLQHCKQLRRLAIGDLRSQSVDGNLEAIDALGQLGRCAPRLTDFVFGMNLPAYDYWEVLPEHVAQMQSLGAHSFPTNLSSCTSLVSITMSCELNHAALQALCSLPKLQHVSVKGVTDLAGPEPGPSAPMQPANPWHTLAISGSLPVEQLPLLPLKGLKVLDLTDAHFVADVACGAAAAQRAMWAAGDALALPASVHWHQVSISLQPPDGHNSDDDDEGTGAPNETPEAVGATTTAVLSALSCLLQRQDTPGTLMVDLQPPSTYIAVITSAKVAALGHALAAVDWDSHTQPLTEVHLQCVRVDGIPFWTALRTALPPTVRSLYLGLTPWHHNTAPVYLGLWCASHPTPLDLELFIPKLWDGLWDLDTHNALSSVQEGLQAIGGPHPVSLKVNWNREPDVIDSEAETEEQSKSDVEEEEGSSSDGGDDDGGSEPEREPSGEVFLLRMYERVAYGAGGKPAAGRRESWEEEEWVEWEEGDGELAELQAEREGK